MRENWERYIEIAKAKSISHTRVAQYWDVIYNITNIVIITLGASTTFLSLIKSVPSFVISAVAAVTTLTSAIMAFMRPHDRRQIQIDSAKTFKVLMLRMVRCETEQMYDQLWLELNKAVMDEPFLPNKFKTGEEDLNWTLSPELQIVIAEKDHELEEVLESRAPTPCAAARIVPTTTSTTVAITRPSQLASPTTTVAEVSAASSPVGRNKYDEVDFSNGSSLNNTNDDDTDNEFDIDDKLKFKFDLDDGCIDKPNRLI